MTEAVEVPIDAEDVPVAATCFCQSYLRATEHAALKAARWLGRADQEGAEEAAADGMRQTIDILPIAGRVVIGSIGEEGGLLPGTILGAGGGDGDFPARPAAGGR